jgi:hypothetical protein
MDIKSLQVIVLDKLSKRDNFISDSTESTIVAGHMPVAVATFVDRLAADIAVAKHTMLAAVADRSIAVGTRLVTPLRVALRRGLAEVRLGR